MTGKYDRRLRRTRFADEASNEIGSCLYRVIQEGLRNAVNHAQTRRARVALAGKGSVLRLSVKDAGVGFTPSSSKRMAGLGLEKHAGTSPSAWGHVFSSIPAGRRDRDQCGGVAAENVILAGKFFCGFLRRQFPLCLQSWITHPTGATATVTRALNLETTDCRIYNADVDGVDLVAVRIREAIWFEKLQKARKAFSVASANVRALKTEHQSLPPNDGHYAYGQALVSEMNARIEYDRVSRIFRHIALRGSLPD